MKRLPTKDSSVETSADYMPDVVKERKVHFMLEDQDTLEEDTTNAMDRVDSEDDVECDDQEESSEDHSSDSDTSDTSDTGDSNDDSMIVQCGSSELITSSDPSQTGDLNIDHLFRQFIELGQHPSFKLSSLDQVARYKFYDNNFIHCAGVFMWALYTEKFAYRKFFLLYSSWQPIRLYVV